MSGDLQLSLWALEKARNEGRKSDAQDDRIRALIRKKRSEKARLEAEIEALLRGMTELLTESGPAIDGLESEIHRQFAEIAALPDLMADETDAVSSIYVYLIEDGVLSPPAAPEATVPRRLMSRPTR